MEEVSLNDADLGFEVLESADMFAADMSTMKIACVTSTSTSSTCSSTSTSCAIEA